MNPAHETAAGYRHFADLEARGGSPLYVLWCTGISEDNALLELLETLPPARRHPELLLGAARYLGAGKLPYSGFRSFVLGNWDSVRELMKRRGGQSDDPGWCAALLPLLAALARREGAALSLIETGASAGLCLYPDRYSYSYGPAGGSTVQLHPGNGPSLVPPFECGVRGAVPVPEELPEVAWRAVVGHHVLEVDHNDDVAWLEALVRPEQAHRREQVRAAAGVVREDPPLLVRGGLMEYLPALLDHAPVNSAVVMLDTGGRLSAQARRETAARLPVLAAGSGRTVHWISFQQEGTRTGPEGAPARRSSDRRGRLLLHDGAAVARTGPQGQWIEWLTPQGR